MKKRYIYSILVGTPGFFITLIITFILFGAAAGFLWIFVYGDNPWPQFTEKILSALFVLTFLVLWVISISIGFVTGKKLEVNPGLNKNHILLSVCATTLPIILIIFHQLHVGNIGAKTDGQRCSEYCSEKGYSASGMPPKNSGERTCSCFDSAGQEIKKVPMGIVISNKQK
jgi:hypothetical protein